MTISVLQHFGPGGSSLKFIKQKKIDLQKIHFFTPSPQKNSLPKTVLSKMNISAC